MILSVGKAAVSRLDGYDRTNGNKKRRRKTTNARTFSEALPVNQLEERSFVAEHAKQEEKGRLGLIPDRHRFRIKMLE